MKLTVIGVKRIKGDKSKAGNPFDICMLFALVPIEMVSNEKMQVTGGGFELAEIPLDTDAIPAFQKLSFPVQLDLQTDTRPRFGKFESVVTGFTPVAKAA